MNTSAKRFVPVMLTPFLETGQIDYFAMSALIDFYLKAGASGLFANCLSSEMFELSKVERIKTIKYTVDAVKGRVPVIATGTFPGTIQQQADYIKKVYDTGVQAVIIITSLLVNNDEPDEILDDRIFELISKTENVPLGFYECPVPYKRLISAKQLQQFVATGRVIYHKDTSLDINQVSQKVNATQGYNFGLYDAYMVHAVESLRTGSAGLSSIQGNFFPELITWLCKNYDNYIIQKEVDIAQFFLTTHMETMHDAYPVAAKYFLQKRGLPISTNTRRNVGEFTLQNKKQLDELFNQYEVLKQKLNI